MNLEKAKEILIVMKKEQVYLLDPDGGDAVQLGIEAMEAIQLDRKCNLSYAIGTLPGETED